eukprot:1449456-Pyramimonas_sp.AAC.2
MLLLTRTLLVESVNCHSRLSASASVCCPTDFSPPGASRARPTLVEAVTLGHSGPGHSLDLSPSSSEPRSRSTTGR